MKALSLRRGLICSTLLDRVQVFTNRDTRTLDCILLYTLQSYTRVVASFYCQRISNLRPRDLTYEYVGAKSQNIGIFNSPLSLFRPCYWRNCETKPGDQQTWSTRLSKNKNREGTFQYPVKISFYHQQSIICKHHQQTMWLIVWT